MIISRDHTTTETAARGLRPASLWLTTAANEHGNRADDADYEGRRAEHDDDLAQGIDGGALHQMPERTEVCRIMNDGINNDVKDNEENKTE